MTPDDDNKHHRARLSMSPTCDQIATAKEPDRSPRCCQTKQSPDHAAPLAEATQKSQATVTSAAASARGLARSLHWAAWTASSDNHGHVALQWGQRQSQGASVAM